MMGEGQEGREEKDTGTLGRGDRWRGNNNSTELHQACLDREVCHQWWMIGEGEVSSDVDLSLRGREGDEEGNSGSSPAEEPLKGREEL